MKHSYFEDEMNPRRANRWICFAALFLIALPGAVAQEGGSLLATHFHLASRVPHVEPITDSAMLDRLEGLCRFDVQWQNAQGAIIDPYLEREYQYSTPYFAYAVGVLASAGRAPDLLPHGVAAMEHATVQFSGGIRTIPDGHSEFFLASLSEALEVYEPLIPHQEWMRWHDRMMLPTFEVIGPTHNNNWRTYGMKGEWKRACMGLVSHTEAVTLIEKWWTTEQRARFAAAPTRLYHDRSSDPDTLSVALVGEGNLLSLVLNGYDGPSATDIRTKVLAALRATVLLVDPSGQVPANGRTDDHIWTEIGMQLAFSVAAPMLRAEGDVETADAMERITALSFAGVQRWSRTQDIWKGSYFITKNHFNPLLRVGYQNASQMTNYTGALMFHLAEMYEVRRGRKPANLGRPTPQEVGGYAFELDSKFASVFADAGGLQMQINLRGETMETNDNWWTPLGVVRIARSGWETRLGPSDGAQTSTDAASFAPEFLRGGKWRRLEQLPKQYQATWSVQTVNPAIVRATLEYHPVEGSSGPSFRDRFILTPIGVLSTVEAMGGAPASWAFTLPLLVNDGQPLKPSVRGHIAETSYSVSGDQADKESFLALDPGVILNATAPMVRSTYGDLLPVRATAQGAVLHIFVYPNDATQPDAASMLASIQITPGGFHSTIGSVEGNVYVGKNFAGGRAHEVDLQEQGGPRVKFADTCGFVMQLHDGSIQALEVDRPTTATIGGKKYNLDAYAPLQLQ
jgi:hypothetical protein